MTDIIRTTRVAIVGMGQLGGSLALRLKTMGALEIVGIARRQASIDEALDRGIIDRGGTDPDDLLGGVDLVVLCVPLEPSIDFVTTHLEAFRPGSLVTDVGSAKLRVVTEIRPLLAGRGVYFIGSHPMAGSEKAGLGACCETLYDNATVFLTPTSDDDPEAVALMSRIWRDIGGCPIELDAARHDRAVAYVSHHLHLLSAALVTTVMGDGDVEAHHWAAAGGFRDTTRIAAANAEMWVNVCRHNRQPVLDAIAHLQRELSGVSELLAKDDWEGLSRYLTKAKGLRDEWFGIYTRRRDGHWDTRAADNGEDR